MDFYNRIRGTLHRLVRRVPGSLDRQGIRDIVEESLEETEATSELVERAEDAHDRARDLMRQGHFEEALARFQESLQAWEAQAALCREKGFKNLWRGKPLQVGREMEDLRITHLDVLDTGSYQYLARRARLRKNQLARVLEMAGDEEGITEKEIHEAFPPDQREEIRVLIFHAERRNWLRRENVAGRYRLRRSESAPEITAET